MCVRVCVCLSVMGSGVEDPFSHSLFFLVSFPEPGAWSISHLCSVSSLPPAQAELAASSLLLTILYAGSLSPAVRWRFC